MDYKKSDSMEKCMKELKKGITTCTYKSLEIVKETSTGEAGSNRYPQKDRIDQRPDIIDNQSL